MYITLDKHELAERQVWQKRNFENAIDTVVRTLQNVIVSIHQIRKDPDAIESPGKWGLSSTPTGKAHQIINEAAHILSNVHLARLATTAADLEKTLQSLEALERLRRQLPETARRIDQLADEHETQVKQTRRLEATAKAERERQQCWGSVYGGPGRRSGRCHRKATASRSVDGQSVQVCASHLKSRLFSVWEKEKPG